MKQLHFGGGVSFPKQTFPGIKIQAQKMWAFFRVIIHITSLHSFIASERMSLFSLPRSLRVCLTKFLYSHPDIQILSLFPFPFSFFLKLILSVSWMLCISLVTGAGKLFFVRFISNLWSPFGIFSLVYFWYSLFVTFPFGWCENISRTRFNKCIHSLLIW